MEEKTNSFIGLATLILTIVGFVTFIAPVQAATFDIHTSDASLTLGETALVSILVSSSEQALNAVSGTLVINPAVLEIVGLSRSSEAVTTWIQEPSYNHSSGLVHFEGISLNPGWQGSSATLITLTVKAKAAGVGRLLFSSGSVLANDGLGTNILTAMGSKNIVVTSSQPLPSPIIVAPTPDIVEVLEVSTPELAPVPAAPNISSRTHPNPLAWSNNNDPSFNWSLSPDITGVNILSTQNTKSDVSLTSNEVFATWSATDVADGEWHFKARLQNHNGWGAFTSYPFKIDTTAPTGVTAEYVTAAASGLEALRLNASDDLSGLQSYVIALDGASPIEVAATDLVDDLWFIPALTSGEHSAVIVAKDAVLNSSQITINFNTSPDVGKSVFLNSSSPLIFDNKQLIALYSAIIATTLYLVATFISWRRRHR